MQNQNKIPMKKITSILCILCIAVLFSACKKEEGVYNPPKKISKITYRTNATDAYGDEIGPTTITQQWIWNKNHTLKEIVENDGNNQKTYQFVYDKKKRIERVNIDGRCCYEYTYDGNYLKGLKRFSTSGKELESYTFIHSDGKISEIRSEMKLEDDYPNEKMAASMFSPLQFVLPEEVTGLMKKEQSEHEKKNGTKGGSVLTILKLFWAKENVIQIESDVTETWNVNSPNVYEETYHLTIGLCYDTGHNPFCGFLLGDVFDMGLSNETAFNKNNIEQIDVLSDRPGQPYIQYRYQYRYEQKYPIVKWEMAHNLYTEEFEYK